MDKARHGYRRIARALTRETGNTVSKSAAQRFLAKSPPAPKPKATPMRRPSEPMVEFGADYVSKRIVGGKQVHILNIVDHYNSGIAVLDNHYKASAWATVASFRELRSQVPEDVVITIHIDNGSPFKNEIVEAYCARNNIRLDFIPAGMPWKNGICEHSNRTVQEEALSLEFLGGVKHMQVVLDDARRQVNERENMNLGYRTPAQMWQEADKPALETAA